MSPSRIALNNPAAVYVLLLIIIIVGMTAYLRLPREASPDITIPLLIVTIPFPGASPEDVESLVARKVELELKDIDDLEKLKTTSSEGVMVATVEFDLGIDLREARNDLREKLDNVKPDLPADAEDPIISEIKLSETPLLVVNLSGRVDLVALRQIAEDLEEELSGISGILDVRLSGGLEKEVRVYADPQRLQHYNVDLNMLASSIRSENTNLPGGNLLIGQTKYLIRVPAEIEDPTEIEDFVLSSSQEAPVQISDVAEVSFDFQEPLSYARLDGAETVSLSVIKRSGENLLAIREHIRQLVGEYGERYKDRVSFVIVSDSGKFVERINSDLENNIITGFIFVFVVLFVAMGVRNAIFVASAVPLSFLLALAVMQFLGFTLNFVVLFSLILALGMMVDNAIVVVENIYRHMQGGQSRKKAAMEGVLEVAVPITTSTITTLAAFAPLIFMPGIMGEFMTFLPQTLIITLSCSLFVGLVINPVVCGTLMRAKVNPNADPHDELAVHVTSRFLRGYRWFLNGCLHWRGPVLVVAIAAFGGTLFFYASTTLQKRGVEFFPASEPENATINIQLPVGSELDATDAITQVIEGDVLPYQAAIENRIATVGRGALTREVSEGSSHLANILLAFPDWQHWDAYRPSEVLAALRKKLDLVLGAEVTVNKQQAGPPVGAPVNIEVHGEDFAAMIGVVNRVKARIKDVPGLVDLRDDFDRSRPEVRVYIDREKTARAGLRTQQVATAVRTAFNGTNVSEYRAGEEEYDIVVRLKEDFRRSIDDLEGLFLRTSSGEQVPISELARVETAPSYGTIRRTDQERVITVSANSGGPPGAVLLTQAQAKLKDITLPAGVTLAYTGENEERQESQEFLSRSFIIALLLIFLVLVAQFNSVSLPFIILSSVILSLIGVFWGLDGSRSPLFGDDDRHWRHLVGWDRGE